MKKILKHVVPLILVAVMCMGTALPAFAAPPEDTGEPGIMPILDTPPEYECTNYPYTAESRMHEYTYTFYYFKSNSDGKLYTKFNGSVIPGTCEVTITLIDRTDGSKTPYSLGTGESWKNRVVTWKNLNPSHNYYFKVSKTNKESILNFTMGISKSNSF